MREFVLVSGNIPMCYCGNAKDFGDCTRDGYPRQNPRAVATARYAVASSTDTDRCSAASSAAVEATRLRCQCGRMVSKARKALGAGRLDGRLRALRTQDPRPFRPGRRQAKSRTNARPRRANDLLPQRYPRRQADQHIDRLLLRDRRIRPRASVPLAEKSHSRQLSPQWTATETSPQRVVRFSIERPNKTTCTIARYYRDIIAK